MQRIIGWVSAKFDFDPPYAATGVLLLITAAFYYGVVITPAVLWIFGAYHQGQQLLEKQACQTRAGAAHTSLVLADGGVLKGNVIERSDKLIALLTTDAVVMVADGEKGARVVESTSLESIKCGNK